MCVCVSIYSVFMASESSDIGRDTKEECFAIVDVKIVVDTTITAETTATATTEATNTTSH